MIFSVAISLHPATISKFHRPSFYTSTAVYRNTYINWNFRFEPHGRVESVFGSPSEDRLYVFLRVLPWSEIFTDIMHPLRTRHSWPPLCESRSISVGKKIDEDPFAFFISPIEDRDIFFEADLAAGIRDNRWKSRSLSPVYHRRPHKIRKVWSHIADSPTSTFKRWIDRMEKQYFHRGPTAHAPPPPSPSELPPPPTSPPLRGRSHYRTGASQRGTHSMRSRSGRPRSWRVPSTDIWPVLEEQEDGD